MKEIGNAKWTFPNTGATNESGFTAIPAGARDSQGNFGNQGNVGYFWSNTSADILNAWPRSPTYNSSELYRFYNQKLSGFSVRCMRD